MQKETEERLNELALKFQEATNLRIADATHRAVRENIALHLELDKMLKVCQDLEDKMQSCKEKEENARLRASLFEKEAEIALNKVLDRNKIIESLLEDHLSASRIKTNNMRIRSHAASKEDLVRSYEDQYQDNFKKKDKLEKNVTEAEDSRTSILEQAQIDSRRMKKLDELLGSVRKLISDLAVKIKTVDCKVCEADGNFKEKLLNIYELLEKLNASTELISE